MSSSSSSSSDAKFNVVDPINDYGDFMANYESRKNKKVDVAPAPEEQKADSNGVSISSGTDTLESEIKKYLASHNPKLYLLTPLFGGVCHLGYMQSLIATMDLFRSYGIALSVEFCRNDSLVTRARNNLIAKAMHDPDTTHMLFIDGDISWTPIDVIKLLIADKALCGGCYPLKKYEFSKLLNDPLNPYNTNVIQSILARKQNTYLKDVISDEQMLRYNLVKYNLNHLSDTLTIERNLAKVRHVATGFMMIQRECIQTMIEAFPSTLYVDDVGYLPSNVACYNLFTTAIESQHLLSEDWYFCSNWSKLGGDIYVDVSINLIHTGTEDFHGSYIASMLS
jgi:hypothetical protein